LDPGADRAASQGGGETEDKGSAGIAEQAWAQFQGDRGRSSPFRRGMKALCPWSWSTTFKSCHWSREAEKKPPIDEDGWLMSLRSSLAGAEYFGSLLCLGGYS